MTEYRVAVSDHEFEDLSIERDELSDIAEVHDAGGHLESDPSIDDQLISADAILNLRYEIEEELIRRLDGCQVIARYGIGVDNIATDVAAEQGIYVTNAPEYCKEEVATHTIALLLSLYRGITRYDTSMVAGAWDHTAGAPVHRLSTQTLGIVGFGSTGRAVAARARALGFDIVTADPFIDKETAVENGAELVEFAELLERSDAVTIHSPLTDGTRGMFDDTTFESMKDSAFLVNVARGPIVDGGALRTALKDGKIAGAGLDVFPDEPPAADDLLRRHERVVATPHVAWYSEEADPERRRTAAQNVRKVLEGEKPRDIVNDM